MTSIPTDGQDLSNNLPTLAHFIEIPIPSIHVPTQLVVHTTQFKGNSLLVWCGEANPRLANSLKSQRTSQANSQTFSEQPIPAISSLLIEENVPSIPNNSSTASSIQPPSGLLGNEWAVAMTSASLQDKVISTSLFRSNLDISKPMTSRLAKRFQISQLILSLSLPDQLLSMLDGPFADPLGGKALMMLEGALGNVIKSTIEKKTSVE